MWILLLLALIYSFQNIYVNPSVTVHSKSGTVIGYNTNLGRVFYGIPFAKPPIGSLRWRPPVPINKWAPLIINGTKKPAACPQPACNMNDILCPQVTSENCLYLNIFTPLQSTSTLLPVMIFIPGGNFQYSSASIPVYDADRFVNTTNVICVIIQYRLGILGFLATGSSQNDLEGNYGILDQRLAIAWIKANIRAFGGNPTKITLFGQSAGAQSIVLHYTTKQMQSLFRAAIIESAPLTIPFRTYEEYTIPTTILAQQLNCTIGNITCFRASSYQNIIAAQTIINGMITSGRFLHQFEPWVPVIDNSIVHGHLMETIANISLPRKPLIIGTMSEEGLSYVYSTVTQPLVPFSYNLTIQIIFGDKSSKVLQRYPPQGSGDQRPLLAQVTTQWIFACPARIFAHKTNGYSYVFGYPLYTRGLVDAGVCEGRSCHGYELPFLFKSFWTYFNQSERYVSQQMVNYWTNYAKTENPNRPVKVPLQWSKLGRTPEKPLYFQNPVVIRKNYLSDDCNFWDTLNYYVSSP